MNHFKSTSLHIITLFCLISAGLHTELDQEITHEYEHINTLYQTYSHTRKDSKQQEHKESHDHETCHICYFMYSMDNDATELVLPINELKISQINLNYNFNTIYEVLLRSRAPPC